MPSEAAKWAQLSLLGRIVVKNKRTESRSTVWLRNLGTGNVTTQLPVFSFEKLERAFSFKVLSHINLQLLSWEPSEEMVNQLIRVNLKNQEIGKQSIWLEGKVVP